MVDEDFISFSDLVEDLSDIDGSIKGVFNDDAVNMEIEEVEMEVPVELSISVDDMGKVTLGGTPPQYSVETTIMPVFHQLKLKLITIDKFEQNGE